MSAECMFYSELLCYYSIVLRLFSVHVRCSASLLTLALPTSDSKMDIFAWLSNIYR